MAYLTKTTFAEIATILDELGLNEGVAFSTEDPDELLRYELEPCHYNIIRKAKLIYEENYVIIIGEIDGNHTIAKDICILSNGNVNDDDARIDGIEEFLEEYYDKYMSKNKDGNVYLIEGV